VRSWRNRAEVSDLSVIRGRHDQALNVDVREQYGRQRNLRTWKPLNITLSDGYGNVLLIRR
jgi:hypothetical protein